MRPSAPLSVPMNINIYSSDEELVLFLGDRKVGDPVPANVITEEKPWGIEPWNSHEDRWYLYIPEDPQSLNGEDEIKATRMGYWKTKDELRIFTHTPTVGRKTIREFYTGKTPYGNKTGWMMHELQAEQKTHQGINKEQDYSSLCRVFFQIDERSNHGEQHNSIIADGAGGDYGEHMLLNMPEQEENNLSSRDAANTSQMFGRDEQGQLALSGTSVTGPVTDNCAEEMYETCDFSKEDYLELNDLNSPVTDNCAEDMYATCDFSKEDYLELNDLNSQETSSSSSDNSSRMSENSDEYFDADALLRDLENECNEEVHVDSRYSVSASVQSNQVVIRPPTPGSVCSSGSGNLVVEGGSSANPVPEKARASHHSSSADELSDSRMAYTSGTQPGSPSDQSSSGSSHGSRTSRGQGSKSGSRISKLGKKYYCCFGLF